MRDGHKTSQIHGSKYISIVANLYWNQCPEININRNFSENSLIKKRVHQRCVLSPIIFNLYFEAIFNEELHDDNNMIRE